MEKKLHRDEFKKVVAGVCAGLAEYFDIDVSIIRVVFLLSLLLKGGGVLIYIVLWIVLPKKGLSNIPPVDYTMPPAPGRTYQSNAPAYQQMPPYIQKKHPTTGALIGGLIMIMLGVGFLLDQFSVIPDWEFEMWWPLILVVIGLVLIFSHRTQAPAPFQPWAGHTPEQEAVKPDPASTTTTEEPLNNNPTEKL